MKRLKFGITPQLIILVGFASIFSLLILAIVVGVYFSNNLNSSRLERLEVIAQLKTTQIRQAEEFVFYQVYWLTMQQSISRPLNSYMAGNESLSLFADAQSTLDQFLTSSEQFGAARLYNLELDVIAESRNNLTMVSQGTSGELFPLHKNETVPLSLLGQYNTTYPSILSGPSLNSSDAYGSYFMGLTLPVYGNTSIIFDTPVISGYLSVIANAGSIKDAINDTDKLYSKSKSLDYEVLLLQPVYEYINASARDLVGYKSIFPLKTNDLEPRENYNINESSLAKVALLKDYGSSTHVTSRSGVSSAIGYSRFQADNDFFWSIVIQQKRSRFLGPLNKLKHIMIGVVIGIAAFMCIITFLLALWFIGPIKKLKQATEEIIQSRKQKGFTQDNSTSNYPPYLPVYRSTDTLSVQNNPPSIHASTSTSIHSTAIRLPDKIPISKKVFKDELTELTDAFNIMIEELDRQYTHLEDRVKMRTKELEALKIEAETANEAKTVFIANISHELRTPLNGILGMTAIAMDETDISRIQSSLKLIYRSGELLLHILTELLTFSKNTLNRSKLVKSNFQILDVANQVKSIFGKLAIDQRVTLRLYLKPNVIRKLILFGDSNRIIQVVMNLVSNSLKFTPVDGSVDVSFRLLGEYDKDRLAAKNFQNVYVVKHKDSPIYRDDTQKKEFVEDERNLNKDSPESVAIKSSSSDIGLSSSYEKHVDSGSSDSTSMTTISTSEYRNTINRCLTNKLRRLSCNTSTSGGPSISEKSSHDKGQSINETEVRSNIHEMSEKTENLKSDEVKSEKGETTEKSSLLSVEEITKNDKRFSIKKLHQPKSWVIQIEVTDTGPGIEPALQKKVFDPFIQGDQTLSRSYGGTGLGLSICRQLAKMMNGTLTLKSTIGVGSTFTFTLPLLQTGEIMIDDSEMKDFCEDEFNPLSKMNRKIVFSPVKECFPPEISESDKRSEGAFRQSNPSSSSENSEFAGTVEGEHETRVNELPRSNITMATRFDESPKPSLRPSQDTRGYFEPPHVMTNTSTGTASSPSYDKDTSNIMKYICDRKILVAEDNMVNQEVIKRMLQLEGFSNISMVCNGAEAVEIVKICEDANEPFDLIFMDVQMPKMDGLLATTVIRNTIKYKGPIIALTAFADESNVKKCLSSGMSGFLSKPIKRSELKKIVTEFNTDNIKDTVNTP